MKKLLIVYPRMTVGGSTTSLLGLLSIIDYEEFDVDLLLYKKEGDLIGSLPKEINILEAACRYDTVAKERLYKVVHPLTMIKKIQSRRIAKKSNHALVESQLMCYENARLSRRLDTEYNVAIAFLEGWPSIYVSKYVIAKRKIAWVHVDYANAGFDPQYDEEIYNRFDSIVAVSLKCLVNLKNTFPNHAKKMCYIDNISDVKSIINKSKQEIDVNISNEYINLISVCRLSMRTKGLDRMLDFIHQCVNSGSLKVRWYVLGTGPDETRIKELIREKNIQEYVFLLGENKNPFPYMKIMDAFVLLSRYEGKPMVITEAEVLQIPIFVTEYSSAHEQIVNGENGYILPNDDKLCIATLMELLIGGAIEKLKDTINNKGFNFDAEIKKIHSLMD